MEHLIKYNKNNTFSTQNLNTKGKIHDKNLNDFQAKQCSIITDFKSNDKQEYSKQTVERKEQIQSTINSRYQLNVHNYITELHNRLIKECKDNLLDCNTLNAKLDIDSLNNITNRTLNAIKVLYIVLEYNYLIKMNYFYIDFIFIP